jgi:regulator of protease activity HflC (stomatin/prohibitin superfamily)
VLRERIANFEAPSLRIPGAVGVGRGEATKIEGVSINDLRKNLNALNEQMDHECRQSAARYGIVLDASLITGIDPPKDVESALAAINTAHNEVSAEISTAHALADQKIEQSKRAVEIETMRAEAEAQPLLQLAERLSALKAGRPNALKVYVRNASLDLIGRARRVFLEEAR